MAIVHHLGFPRIGANRELKWAVEKYWKGEITQDALEEIGKNIRHDQWQRQLQAKHDFLSVGDFSWYDHVLETSLLLGVIPERFFETGVSIDLNTYFRMARGRAPQGQDTRACEMTKWFDTNYHYIVPEFSINQNFTLSSNKLFAEIEEAKKLHQVKPVLLGPLSYLWLGKTKSGSFDKLILLEKIRKIYQEILIKLAQQGIEWVQIDEPILVLDLSEAWQQAFRITYEQLQIPHLKLLLTTYFGGVDHHADLVCQLPTAGLHIDVVRAETQVPAIMQHLPDNKILSVGIIDGRNIWRANLRRALQVLQPLHQKLGERLWIGSSCSLLHCPIDLENENKLDPELKSWLAFATQKLHELHILGRGLNEGESAISQELDANDSAFTSRAKSTRIHRPEVKSRCAHIPQEMTHRFHPYAQRQKQQKALLKLPLFPTTTIGSFPQTQEIRLVRQEYKTGKRDIESYKQHIFRQIYYAIKKQMELDLDVLVHGESERNDMVEYFGELLEGFAFTSNGWVQSYGSRYVKPPIIFGDVKRHQPMTLEWISYAQSLTDRPVKGMLTGPMTILCWSFVRDDQPRFETAKQIALALRDEVMDLVHAGIHVIQIDEPAIREGLPLRENFWQDYLHDAVYAFKLASCSVPDYVQIHTHMCYSEFNDIIKAIADLDADVITIETSRSDMELLQAFEKFHYPNDIGPGVYDIHSPRVPSTQEMVHLLEQAARFIPVQQLWVNPDCGLKTRDWLETELALKNMVAAAQTMRQKHIDLVA